MSKLLTVVIPAFNEEENIEHTTFVVKKTLNEAQIQHEIIFVSDGSKDGTYEKIKNEAAKDRSVRGIEFSRNFGKESAILAGIDTGNGDCFVIMDCDLQHPPETIVTMYTLWEEGWEIVEGVKNSRGKEGYLHKKLSAIFYSVISKLTGFDMKDSSDFKLIDRKVAKILLSLPERKTFFRALTFWTGYKSRIVLYDVAERNAGTTKWSTKQLIKYALSNIISFSAAPLNIVSYIGIISIFCSILLGIQTFIRWLSDNAIEGFTTVILLLLIIGGCILVGLGLIGKYIAAIYEEIKHRPRYMK